MALVKFRLRRDTAANWTSENPTLALGEPGLETDTGKIKHGDGATAWAGLSYQTVGWADIAGKPTFPSGAIVGTNDVQSLTNKTYQGTLNVVNLGGGGQISSGGAIGIATAPARPIHISGSTAATAAMRIQGTGSASGTVELQSGGSVFEITGGIGLTLTQSGSGITAAAFSSTAFSCVTATTASAANLYQASSGSALLRSTSSLRYKTAVEPMDRDIARRVFREFSPIFYRSLAEADPREWSYYGAAAEEVAKLDTRLVHWDWNRRRKDGTPTANAKMVPDAVQYDRLLLAALLGARIEIDEMKERMEALEARFG